MNIRKVPSFIKMGLGFILIALLSPNLAQGAPLVSTACARALNDQAISAKLDEDRDTNPASDQTIQYLGHNNKNQVVFLKADKKSVWASLHSFYETSPQGDIRWFFNFAGLELAKNLGFEIRETEEGIFILAPNAKLLKEKVEFLNSELAKQNKELITGLPVKSGYLNAQQILELSVNTKEPYVLYFPYEDDSKELTVHEVAFHLFMIFYQKRFLVKAREINLEILKLVADLKKSGLPKAEMVAQAILDSRTTEYDAGSSLLGVHLAQMRADNPQVSYANLLQKHELYIELLVEPMTKLVNPALTIRGNVFSKFMRAIEEADYLNAVDKEKYFKWRETKFSSNEPISNVLGISAEILARGFVDSLDARIEDFNAIFRAHKEQNSSK